MVKNVPAMQETWVQSLCLEDPWRREWLPTPVFLGLPWWLRWQRICLQYRRPRFDPWFGKIPGEGNGYPLQYSCLKNSMDSQEPGGLQSMGLQRVGHD